MSKSRINWLEVQEFYDSGKTIAECCKQFGFCPDTAWKAGKSGKLVIRDKSSCQKFVIRKPLTFCSDRLSSLADAYMNGSSYRELLKLGFKVSEYKYARDNKLIELRSTAEQIANRIKKYGPNSPGLLARQALSIRQSTANTGGRCKWFEVAGQKVQGTWERDFALELERRQIKWKKPKLHAEVFHYMMDDKQRNYTPDFYLLDLDLYIEVKGYWWGRDKEKMDAVKKQNPNVKILIVEKQQLEEFMLGKQIW